MKSVCESSVVRGMTNPVTRSHLAPAPPPQVCSAFKTLLNLSPNSSLTVSPDWPFRGHPLFPSPGSSTQHPSGPQSETAEEAKDPGRMMTLQLGANT